MQHIDNFPARRIQVINNGVECSRFSAVHEAQPLPAGLVIPEGALLVGTAARLEPVKNLPMMIRSFQIVLEQVPRAMLVVAGAGSEREALGHLAQELGIADRVQFLGHRDDLDALLPLLRVFLLSSFTEGISVTLLESMACGVPAVVTRVGGNLDIVADGVTGYLVDSGDHRGFARQVIHYLNNPDLAREHGSRARERVRERFSFQSMLDAYFCHYDALAGTRL
jgi:glycosyltransferase involved in cell wall biosynthesis